ncbi:MAG: glycosyltransferase [Ectothiorhodospiraceae bacterium]|nr:glycosyltransferase [Ectothiorhodospiraceae bacterium]
MRLLYDVTKAHVGRHASGLMRVSRCLGVALARVHEAVVPVRWHGRRRAYVTVADGAAVIGAPTDALLVPELFCEPERPGHDAWLAGCRALRVALFHDAIPLQHPEFSWPQSVQRHPHYLKSLTGLDLVLAVSRASERVLAGYWDWLGVTRRPRLGTIRLGADLPGVPRAARADARREDLVLAVGIVEPRKGQDLLLDALEQRWAAGASTRLVLVGRVNPHFGRPMVARVRALRRRRLPVEHHTGLDDAALGKLLARASLLAFPSRAEGLGLPVLEAMWMGVPCVASDIPSVRETADGGGCALFPSGDATALRQVLDGLLGPGGAPALARLRGEAVARELPTWTGAAQQVVAAIGAAGAGRDRGG